MRRAEDLSRTEVLGDRVALYIPASLEVTDSADYANQDLGTIGAVAKGAIEGTGLTGTSFDAIKDEIVNSGSDAVKSLLGKNVDPAIIVKVLQQTRFA